MTERILRLKPDEVAKFFAECKMEVVQPVSPVDSTIPETSHISDNKMIEQAKKLLGKDFLGVEAIRNMETKLKGVEVNVEFVIDNIPLFPYDEQDLQFAKDNGEMLVLRPETMLKNSQEVPLTLINFQKLFLKNPLNETQTVFFNNKDLDGWYKRDQFAKKSGEIRSSWSLVKKDILDGSTNKGWHPQSYQLDQYKTALKIYAAKNAGVRRRTATEAVYDELLYYINTGERLLPDKLDWTRTLASVDKYGMDGKPVVCVDMFLSNSGCGRPVCIGNFGLSGLFVGADRVTGEDPNVGVCPSR